MCPWCIYCFWEFCRLVLHTSFSAGALGRPVLLAAALVSGIEPILNPVWVAVVSGEMISAVSVAGAVIVIAAVVAYNVIRAREPRKVPAENSGK